MVGCNHQQRNWMLIVRQLAYRKKHNWTIIYTLLYNMYLLFLVLLRERPLW